MHRSARDNVHRIRESLNKIHPGSGDEFGKMTGNGARHHFNDLLGVNVENGDLNKTLEIMADIAEEKAKLIQ